MDRRRSRSRDREGSPPPPPRRRRRTGPSGWDVKPAGWVEGMPLPTEGPTGVGGASVENARTLRQLYVGMPGNTNELEIRSFFDDVIRRAAATPIHGAAILSIYYNPDRKFAYVEFQSPELANAIMDLDRRLQFRGAPFKIARPDEYSSIPLPPEEKARKTPLNLAALPLLPPPTEGGGATGAVGGAGAGAGAAVSGVRIFIGNIPQEIKEESLRELAVAFGQVKGINLVKSADGINHKGYGFVDFVDGAAADMCIAGLNGLPVGSRSLTAARAKVTAGGGGAAGGASTGSGSVGSGGLGAAHGAPASSYGGGYGAPPPPPQGTGYGMPPPPPPPPSSQYGAPAPLSVVLLENMVSAAELADEAEYRDILLDVQNECGKYGPGLRVNMPRPPHPGAGRIFLEYPDLRSAQAAMGALAGRTFGTQPIVARLYDPGAYAAGVLTA